MRATNCPRPEPPETALRTLRDSWVLSLQARNLSPKTIKIYRDAANDLLRHLDATRGPDTPESSLARTSRAFTVGGGRARALSHATRTPAV
jgi:hypothetical protein